MNSLVGLPHGARGPSIDDFAIEFGNDKSEFFIDRNSRKHHTLHFGPSSGVLDVHRTWIDREESNHKTLFAIEHPELLKALEDLVRTTFFQDFLFLYRPLRVGWLNRHNVTLVRGLEILDGTTMAAVSVKGKRRRLTIDERRFRSQITEFEPIEVYRFPDGAFSLVAKRRNRVKRIGIGFKQTDPSGRVWLRWVKMKDLRKFMSSGHPVVMRILEEHAIPPERYLEFPFLVP